MKAAGAEPNIQLDAPAPPGPGPDSPADPIAVAVRNAATVILVSDRPDLHVLVLERTSRAAFGPGATVFPGGAVDRGDGDPELTRRVRGLDDETADREQGIRAGGLAYRLAAVRECFEEAGILLAREAASNRRVDHDAALAAARGELNAGSLTFGEFVADARSRARRAGAAACSPTGSRPWVRRAGTTPGSSSHPRPTAKTARTTTTSSSRRLGSGRSTRSRSTPAARSTSSSRPR